MVKKNVGERLTCLSFFFFFFSSFSFRFLYNAMTLNLGRAQHLTSDSGSASVRLIILERLPPTLLFMSIASFSLFFLSLVFALFLSRNYGSFVDKLVIALSPTSSAPPWFYGIFFWACARRFWPRNLNIRSETSF